MASMKIYKRYLVATGLIWAVCLVLFCLAYMLLLRPLISNEKRLEDRLAEKKQVYESVLTASRTETRIKMNKEIESLIDELGTFVVDIENSANLTFDISQIATEKEVVSFSVKSRDDYEVSPIPNCARICENHIDIGFSAGFHQFATFLNALERHRPVLFIDTFTLTSSKQDGPDYQVTLKVAALVRKQKGGDTAPASP
jgi:hypothetical protein